MYITASINLVRQREKLTGQIPRLAGKCPVTDCYYEHCSSMHVLLLLQTKGSADMEGKRQAECHF